MACWAAVSPSARRVATVAVVAAAAAVAVAVAVAVGFRQVVRSQGTPLPCYRNIL